MRSVNPAVIPRNHRVEEALAAAEERDDLSVLRDLVAALARPYEDRPEAGQDRGPPARGRAGGGPVPGAAGRRVRVPDVLRHVSDGAVRSPVWRRRSRGTVK